MDTTRLFWDDEDGLPSISGYCPSPTCSPSSPCDACILAASPTCDCCPSGINRAAVSVDRSPPVGGPLAVCATCAARSLAEVRPELVAFVGGLVERAAVQS